MLQFFESLGMLWWVIGLDKLFGEKNKPLKRSTEQIFKNIIE